MTSAEENYQLPLTWYCLCFRTCLQPESFCHQADEQGASTREAQTACFGRAALQEHLAVARVLSFAFRD